MITATITRRDAATIISVHADFSHMLRQREGDVGSVTAADSALTRPLCQPGRSRLMRDPGRRELECDAAHALPHIEVCIRLARRPLIGKRSERISPFLAKRSMGN